MTVGVYELEGGPLDGRREPVPAGVDSLDVVRGEDGPVTYRPTDRVARDGTPLLEWAEPPA